MTGDGLIPDIEAVMTGYLKGCAPIAELGARIVGKMPSETAKPWVRITLLDPKAVDDSRSDHLIDWMVQFDCYAGSTGGQGEASLLMRTVRRELRLLYEREAEGAVITGVRFLSAPRQEDTNFEPARTFFPLTATIWGHA